SKTFSVIETGESLWRGDEPSPTRSAVLVRLSHGHIRIGTFQRLAALGLRDEMEALIAYCLKTFPGPPPPEDAPGRDEPVAILLHHVVERLADTAASWMVAGFVHGVLNSDNMNISGESFDYGPWRWLPRWDHGFTAAYFDHAGLYAFGRQPEAVLWNCGQLAIALRTLADSAPLVFALDRFGPLYEAAMARRFAWRLGIPPLEVEAAKMLIGAAERHMRDNDMSPDMFFFAARAGHPLAHGEFAERFGPLRDDDAAAHPLWRESTPPSLVIENVEAIWAAIDRNDDWQPLADTVAAIRTLGDALGPPPPAAGHSDV
ncbi:MAG: protein adenylyltransferase SelO family protein, partial [Novosphingobium sp.]